MAYHQERKKGKGDFDDIHNANTWISHPDFRSRILDGSSALINWPTCLHADTKLGNLPKMLQFFQCLF